MVGASILPACFYDGKLYFLFGKENALADTPGWSDFGGGVDKGESIFQAAMREGGEELTGILGDGKMISTLIKNNGGIFKMQKDTYHIHLFHLPYSEYKNMPKFYNNTHYFLWNRMDKKMLNDTKLFEKIEIQWFTIEEMKKRRDEFRNFYRDIVDMIIDKETEVREFLEKKMTKPKHKGTRKKSSNKGFLGIF
jgi:8-oxo-dGTP pyrophosphatase MutT (NUDIX family)